MPLIKEPITDTGKLGGMFPEDIASTYTKESLAHSLQLVSVEHEGLKEEHARDTSTNERRTKKLLDRRSELEVVRNQLKEMSTDLEIKESAITLLKESLENAVQQRRSAADSCAMAEKAYLDKRVAMESQKKEYDKLLKEKEAVILKLNEDLARCMEEFGVLFEEKDKIIHNLTETLYLQRKK